MSAFTSKATGNWDTEGQTTWNEAGHPGDSDDVTIQDEHTITLDSSTECASLTVDSGGVLTDATNNVGFTNYGATVVNGTFTCGTASIDLQDLTIGDGGLYENGTCLTEINGDLVVGGGVSGSYTVGTEGIILCNNVNKTVTINAGATLGVAATNYDITFYASMASSEGTFIAPNSSGNFTIRTGATWIEPDNFTHSNGEMAIIGSSTATLGSDCEFFNVDIANFATLSTLTYDLTIGGALDIGGGVSGAVVPTTGSIIINGSTNIGTGGTLGANTAYTLDLNGNLVSSSGTLSAPNASGTFTFSGSTFYTPTTFTSNSGTVIFDRVGTTSLSNAALQFYNIEISAAATLDCSDEDLTILSKTSITGTLSCKTGTMSFGSGITADYALSVDATGIFTGGSGTHTIGSIAAIGTGTIGLTSGVTTIDAANLSLSGLAIVNTGNVTISHNNGTVTFTRAGNQFLYEDTNQTFTFYNLILNNASCVVRGLAGKGSPIVVDNDFTITAGTFNTADVSSNSRDLTVAGDTIVNGTLVCNDSTIILHGDLEGSGTITPGTSTVVFETGVDTIKDDFTFYNLTCNTLGSTLSIDVGVSIIVEHVFTINATCILRPHAGTADTTITLGTVSSSGSFVNNGILRAHDNSGTFDAIYQAANVSHFAELTGTGKYYWNYGVATHTGEVHWKWLNMKGTDASAKATGGGGLTVVFDGDNKFFEDFTVTAGDTLIRGSHTMTVAKNFTNLGTFAEGTSTFVMDGTTQSLTGTMLFWHFTKSVVVADTLTFDNTGTYTFGGNVTLNGAAGQLLSLVSDSAGDAFDFIMSAGAVKTNLSYLSVKDSDASGSDATQKPISPTDSVDVSGNTDWFSLGVVTKSSLSYYYY